MKEDVGRKKNENTSSTTADSKKRVSKVKVALILGHSASHRGSKITSEDYTHDWSFYVRGMEGTKIHCYIERVIFKLHESFSNPNQVITKPPYEIHEQGYGTFILEVEVRFRNKREPKSITYKYDLVLPAEGVAPINRCRKEILTFTNPNSEFMSKLLEGGGALHHFDTHGNLISDSSAPSPKPVQPLTLPVPVNKNREHTPNPAPRPSSEDEAIKRAKEAKKEKRKEKREKESTDRSVSKELKKQKKVNKPPEPKVEEKPTKKEKPISNFLADFGDLESSDEEKYFKSELPASDKESVEVEQPAPRKIPQKSKQSKSSSKIKPNREEGQILLEFDKLDEIKSKKKEKRKSDVPSKYSTEKEKSHETPKETTSSSHKPSKHKGHSKSNVKERDETFLEFDDINKMNKVNKAKSKSPSEGFNYESGSEKKRKNKMAIEGVSKSSYKMSKKRVSSLSSDTDDGSTANTFNKDDDLENESPLSDHSEASESQPIISKPKQSSGKHRSHDKKSVPIKNEPFMEFDDVSSLKVIKKSGEKRKSSAENLKRSRVDEFKEADLVRNSPTVAKPMHKRVNEHIINARKRSSSISSDTDDEMQEEGELQSSSPLPDVSNVTKSIPSHSSESREDSKFKQKHEKKNKHKAVKQECGQGYDAGASSGFVPTQTSYFKTEKLATEEVPVKQEVGDNVQYENTTSPLEYVSPTLNQNIPQLHPSGRPQTHFSSSSAEDGAVNNNLGQDQLSEGRHPVASTDHLRLMLNLYSKIHQLQKTNDKSTITEVVNILASDGRSSMDLKDDNVSFDLVNCDIETLRSIENLLL